MVCAAALSGGIYEVEVRAQAGAGKRGSTSDKPAIDDAHDRQHGERCGGARQRARLGVRRRAGARRTVIPDPFAGFTYPIRAWGTLAMTNRCRVTSARPGLSAQGLRGGAVSGLGETFDCPSPRCVDVRDPRRAGGGLLAQHAAGQPRHGHAADGGRAVVATQAGKRLAYAEVARSAARGSSPRRAASRTDGWAQASP